MELIVAKNNKNVIGNNGDLMWHLSKDLQHFRKLTQNQIIVMGRKTYDSLPNGPLKNRINVIITRDPSKYKREMLDVYFVTLEESSFLIDNLQKKYNKSVFIIGGSEIYDHFYPQCQTLHITEVDDDQEGDTYFPINDQQILTDCKIVCKETHRDEKTNMLYSFCTYQKKEN
jgi:dihydrofolate reductase